MRSYLSFGGGVNSTALMILLRQQGIEFEAVFADTGCEWPETYSYIGWLQAHGWPITVIRWEREDLWPLALQCQRYAIIPAPQTRWCTGDYKVKPFRAYIQRPCTVYLGIDAGEDIRRCNPSGDPDVEHVWPLREQHIDRRGCTEIIKRAGLPLPRKSRCWCCPEMNRGAWRDLYHRHPDLYEKALTMETRMNERLAAKGRKLAYFCRDHPLPYIVGEGQLELTPAMGVPPCGYCESEEECEVQP